MKNIDRIAEAFNGKLGQEMMESSRSRVHWMCSHAKGENILDVGCSQGTVSIILAREGKRVIGIDICRESIDYAKRSLDEEDESTRSFVGFECIDFVSHVKNLDQTYDCIIMGEVLEHLSDPLRFVEHAHNTLTTKGFFVITVPFGINDYHDHKRTYYLTEIYNTAARFFVVLEVAFLGSWIGLVCTKASTSSTLFGDRLFSRAEGAFYEVERSLVNKVSSLKSDLDKANTKYRQVSEQYTSLKSDQSIHEKESDKLAKVLALKNKELDETTNRYTKALAERTELLDEATKRYTQALDEHSSERTELLENLTHCTTELGNAVKLITTTDADLQSMHAQITILKNEKNETNNRYTQALDLHAAERTALLDKLAYSNTELNNTTSFLATTNADLQRIHAQVTDLQKEKSSYQWKLNRITNTWCGRIALRAYRLLRKIKRAIK